MKNFETFKIFDTSNLKNNTIYFWLKENGFSEHFLKELRKTPNSMLLNGKAQPINQKIFVGDQLQIMKNPRSEGSKIPQCDGTLEILFEDEDYLVVNKPHLLSCIPSRSHINDNLGGMVTAYMQKTDPSFVLRVINRLDRDTAGLVIIAKNLLSYNNINSIEKTYFALCAGTFNEQNFTINAPIKTITENGINQIKRVVAADGKPSITHVWLEKTFQNHSLLRLSLETGRTHQIRVHLSHIGHSLLGDKIYSNAPQTLSHTFLILKRVSFVHYKTQQRLSFEVPFPEEWNSLLTD